MLKIQQKTSETTSSISVKPDNKRTWWILLFVIVLVSYITSSLIQPLGMSPDESAHVKYIKFVADNCRFPHWKFLGGGEAGYESQHPPLFYTAGAVVYKLTSGLPENWRWQFLRWYTLLIGLALFFVARGLFLEYFKGRQRPALIAATVFSITPLVVEYSDYSNPDIMSALWCTLILWMCIKVARGTATRRDRITLAVSLGLGLLTKATVFAVVPVVIAAHLWEPYDNQAKKWEYRRQNLLLVAFGAMIISAWWYIRNSILYKCIIPHTMSDVTSGIVFAKHYGFGDLIRITLVNTFKSSWVECGWIPPGIIGLSIYLIIAGLILVSVIAAIRQRSKTKAEFNPVPWLCGILLASLFVSHQYQVWTQDFAFNAGGRYMMSGLPAAFALIIGPISTMRSAKLWYSLWIGMLLLMDITVLFALLVVLNGHTVPDWHLMKLSIPY